MELHLVLLFVGLAAHSRGTVLRANQSTSLRLGDAPTCSGDIVVSDVNGAVFCDTGHNPKKRINGDHDSYEVCNASEGHTTTVPASSCVVFNPYSLSWQDGPGKSTMGESSVLWSDYFVNFEANGPFTVGQYTWLKYGVSSGWYQTINVESPFHRKSWTEVGSFAIGDRSSFNLGWAGVVLLDGDLQVGNDCSIDLGNFTMFSIYHSGTVTFQSKTQLVVEKRSELTIRAGSRLFAVPTAGSVSIKIGKFSEVTIPDDTSCFVTEDVSVPDRSLQTWDANIHLDGLSCADVGSEEERAMLDLLKMKKPSAQ